MRTDCPVDRKPVHHVKIAPQTPASYALLAEALPGLQERLPRYRISEENPDPELFGVFVDCIDETLSSATHALMGGDLSAVARLAHGLKGMGGAAGAAEISVLGETMETAARTGQEGTIRELVGRLQAWRSAIA